MLTHGGCFVVHHLEFTVVPSCCVFGGLVLKILMRLEFVFFFKHIRPVHEVAFLTVGSILGLLYHSTCAIQGRIDLVCWRGLGRRATRLA